MPAARTIALACLATLLPGCGTDLYFGAQAGCRGNHGPGAVDLGDFCVDATEVSQADYAAFLANAPPVSGQPTECDWNDHFEPQAFDSDAFLPFTADRAQFPVVGVDFCDARAYCAWAGKRLCGKRGGGPLAADDPSYDADSEWLRACSGAGSQTYPYGTVFDGMACAVRGDEHAVGTEASCEGGFPGLFDLVGNVWEWEDSCRGGSSDPKNDRCSRRGGAYTVVPETWACEDHGDPSPRDARQGDMGIRCCSDRLK